MVDISVLCPIDSKVAVDEVDIDHALCASGDHGCKGCATGSASTGHGDSATAFPDAHNDISSVGNTHEFDVGALREGNVPFNFWTDGLGEFEELVACCAVNAYYRVRIANV